MSSAIDPKHQALYSPMEKCARACVREAAGLITSRPRPSINPGSDSGPRQLHYQHSARAVEQPLCLLSLCTLTCTTLLCPQTFVGCKHVFFEPLRWKMLLGAGLDPGGQGRRLGPLGGGEAAEAVPSGCCQAGSEGRDGPTGSPQLNQAGFALFKQSWTQRSI